MESCELYSGAGSLEPLEVHIYHGLLMLVCPWWSHSACDVGHSWLLVLSWLDGHIQWLAVATLVMAPFSSYMMIFIVQQMKKIVSAIFVPTETHG